MTTKAIFFDIDGTLINIMNQRPQMTEPTRQAILRLRQAGHRTFIASGRPLDYLDPELTEQGLFDGYVLMNGAAVFVDGKCIYEQPLPEAQVRDIIALCEQQGIEYILQGAHHVYLRPEFTGLARFYQGIGIPMTLSEVGIDGSRISEMTHHVAVNEGLDQAWVPLHEDDIAAILRDCL